MSAITEAIRELREKTGAGVMDCRRALESTGGEQDAAVVLLKELGLRQAEKRKDRETHEGRIFLGNDGRKAVLLRLACETDFVASNGDFIRLGGECLALCMDGAAGAEALTDRIREAAARIKENIVLGSLQTLRAEEGGRLFHYVHGEGRIGSVVRLASPDPSAWERPDLRALAADLALHVAAFGPLYLSPESVDPTYMAEKRAEFHAEAKATGKPDRLVEGIARGKLDKHLARVCLLEQGYLRDEASTVRKAIDGLRTGGAPDVLLTGFLYERAAR